MGHWRCLRCDVLTGLPASHPTCTDGAPPDWEHCTCGSGAHPRECVLHPDEYAKHVAELNEFEHDSFAGELLAAALREPEPVAVLRRRLTVARQRVEAASNEECACVEALAEAERLRCQT